MIEFETDSRKIKPGQTFVAIKGFTVDGHSFIDKAIENGATKIIVEEDVNASVPTVKVDSTKEYLKRRMHYENQLESPFQKQDLAGKFSEPDRILCVFHAGPV